MNFVDKELSDNVNNNILTKSSEYSIFKWSKIWQIILVRWYMSIGDPSKRYLGLEGGLKNVDDYFPLSK